MATCLQDGVVWSTLLSHPADCTLCSSLLVCSWAGHPLGLLRDLLVLLWFLDCVQGLGLLWCIMLLQVPSDAAASWCYGCPDHHVVLRSGMQLS